MKEYQRVKFDTCTKVEVTSSTSLLAHNLIEQSKMAHNPDDLCTAHILVKNLVMVAHNPLSKVWGLAVHLDLFIRWYQKSGLELL